MKGWYGNGPSPVDKMMSEDEKARKFYRVGLGNLEERQSRLAELDALNQRVRQLRVIGLYFGNDLIFVIKKKKGKVLV